MKQAAIDMYIEAEEGYYQHDSEDDLLGRRVSRMVIDRCPSPEGEEASPIDIIIHFTDHGQAGVSLTPKEARFLIRSLQSLLDLDS